MTDRDSQRYDSTSVSVRLTPGSKLAQALADGPRWFVVRERNVRSSGAAREQLSIWEARKVRSVEYF